MILIDRYRCTQSDASVLLCKKEIEGDSLDNKNIIQDFMEITKHKYVNEARAAAADMPIPSAELGIPAGAQIIPLPEPDLLPDTEVNFLEVIELRSSIRSYSNKPIALKELSYLLWCTQGVKAVQGNTTLRNVPSACCRHELETWLYIQKVEGLQEGLYRFLPMEHALLPIMLVSQDSVLAEKIASCFEKKGMFQEAAVSFIWSAEMNRITRLCGDRSYRYIFIDSGHICENLYLAAYTQKIGVCAIGAYDDEKLNSLLGLDGVERFVAYAANAGKI